MIPSFLEGAIPVTEDEEDQGIPSFLEGASPVIPQSEVVGDSQTVFPFETEGDMERLMDRGQAQATSRALETIVGLPGDLESFVGSFFGREETFFPTSESLKKFSEGQTEGFTTPQSEAEEAVGEAFQDIVSFGIPIPGSGAPSLARIAGVPIAANLVKQGLKLGGADEQEASAAKIGSLLLLDLAARRITGGGAEKHINSLFKASRDELSEGALLNARKLEKALDPLEKSLKSGGSRPSRVEALKKTKEIRDVIVDGKMPVKEALDFRVSINELKDKLGAFSLETPAKIRTKAIKNLDMVKGNVIEAITDYGKAENPRFLIPYTQAEEAFAARASSDVVSNFVQKTVGKKLASPITKAVFGLALPKFGVAKVAGAFTAKETLKIINQIRKSPTLARFYGNALSAAVKGNAAQVSRNVLALDRKLDKEGLPEES